MPMDRDRKTEKPPGVEEILFDLLKGEDKVTVEELRQQRMRPDRMSRKRARLYRDAVGTAQRVRASLNATIDDVFERWSRPSHVRLMAGEMSAQEMRSVQAVLQAVAADVGRAVKDKTFITPELGAFVPSKELIAAFQAGSEIGKTPFGWHFGLGEDMWDIVHSAITSTANHLRHDKEVIVHLCENGVIALEPLATDIADWLFLGEDGRFMALLTKELVRFVETGGAIGSTWGSVVVIDGSLALKLNPEVPIRLPRSRNRTVDIDV